MKTFPFLLLLTVKLLPSTLLCAANECALSSELPSTFARLVSCRSTSPQSSPPPRCRSATPTELARRLSALTLNRSENSFERISAGLLGHGFPDKVFSPLNNQDCPRNSPLSSRHNTPSPSPRYNTPPPSAPPVFWQNPPNIPITPPRRPKRPASTPPESDSEEEQRPHKRRRLRLASAPQRPHKPPSDHMDDRSDEYSISDDDDL